MLYDRETPSRGGRRISLVRRLSIWRYLRDYFPTKLVSTTELSPKRNYIMGYHPHGVIGTGAFVNFATEGSDFSKVFPGITPYLLTLKCVLYFVLVGCMIDISVGYILLHST